MNFMLIVGIIIVLATVYLLYKQYETRMILFVSGVLMACIAGDPMAAFLGFSKGIKNANLIEPIVAAMGFAMVLKTTECDKHLINLLAKGLKRAGGALIPGAVIATALVNTSITSAAGVSAAVGAVLIPVLIAAGVHPKTAGAAIFTGTFGLAMLNPGFGQVAVVAKVAHSTPMEVVANHANALIIAGLIGTIGVTIVAFLRKEHTGYHSQNEIADETAHFKVNYLKAFVPLLPLILLLLGSTGTVVAFKQLAISHAMIIGVFAAVLVCRFSPVEASKDFFKGFGDGFAQVFGIILCALVFVSGMNSLGLVKALIDAMIANPAIAKISATFGPFILGVISGSGEAASITFNEAVTINADLLGINPLNLGSLAAIAGALGRTMSPIAGAAVICAGFAGVSPIEIVKRTAPGMLVATIVLMLILVY